MKTNNNFNNLITGRASKSNKGKASSLLVGGLRDRDLDSSPTGFSRWVDDCKPNNPHEHGWIKGVVKKVVSIVKPKPTPTPAPLPVSKAPTPIPGITAPPSPTPSWAAPKPTPPPAPKGGTSYVEPSTGKAMYQLPSGERIEATPEATKAITAGATSVSQIQKIAPAYQTPQQKAIVEFEKRMGITPAPKTQAELMAYLKQPQLPTQTGILPYQVRGTAYYEPSKGYYAPTGYVSKAYGEGVDIIAGFGGLPSKIFPTRGEKKPLTEKEILEETYVSPGTLPYQERGTAFVDYKYKGAEGEIGRERIVTETVKLSTYQVIAEQMVGEVYNKYSNIIDADIKSGKITTQKQLDDSINYYNTKAKTETDKEFKSLSKQYEVEATAREKIRVEELTKRLRSEAFRDPTTYVRMGLYAIPYYGTGLFVAETYKGIKEEGVGKTAKEMAVMLPVAIAGGLVFGKVKGAIRARQIKTAIQEGRVVSKYVGKLTEAELGAIKVSEAGKKELQRYLSRGYGLKTYETKLVPKAGLEAKTPKITGKFIEVTDRAGNIIERIAMGEIKASLGGKKLDAVSVARGISKIDQETGGIKGYSEVVTAITRKPPIVGIAGKIETYKRPTISKYLEETKITKLTKDKRAIRLEAETVTSLIGTKKYKGEELLKGIGKLEGRRVRVTPDFDLLTGKPITKTTQRGIQILGEAELKLYKEPRGMFTLVKEYAEKGVGVTRFIKEPPPKIKRWPSYPIYEKAPKPPKVPKPIPREEYVTLYHGTIVSSAKKALAEGLKPVGELKEVYLVETTGYAKGFAGRAASKIRFKEGTEVLKAEMPRSVYEKLLVKRSVGIGGVPEVTLKSVPKEYLSIVAKPKVPTLREGYPTTVGGLGAESPYAYKGGAELVGGLTVSRGELARAEAGGLLAGEITTGFVKEVPKELTRLTVFEATRLGARTEKVFGISTKEEVKPTEAVSLIAPQVTMLTGRLAEVEKVKEKEVIRLAQPTALISGVRQVEVTKLALIEKQAVAQKQATIAKLKMKQVTARPFAPVRPMTFMFPEEIPIIKFPLPKKEEEKPVKRKYLALGRRYGKFGVLGAFETPEKAKRVGAKFALGTLGASFAVKEVGGKFLQLAPTEKFRPAKREPFVLVQKRKFRLASPSERREIQLAKKGIRQFL